VSKHVFNTAAECNLRPALKTVLKEMAWFGDDYGESIWPSVKLLATRTGFSARGIQKQLRELERIGAISARSSRLGGRGKTTRYRIELEWLRKNTILGTENAVRPLQSDQRVSSAEKGEPESVKRANGEPQNSEPHSPEQEEHKNEKYSRPMSRKGNHLSICPKCNGTGSWTHSGHPGCSVYCGCPTGTSLQFRERRA